LSAVGVNFAIEKIVSAVASAHLKAHLGKAISNPVLHRRAKKALHGVDLHASTILLYSPRNAMLKERAALATYLWEDNLPCIYIHPAHLTHSNLKRYARNYMIRWLVVFRRQEFKEGAQVQVVDLHATSSSGGGSKTAAKEADAAVWMPINDVSNFIRSRMAGKREAELSASIASQNLHGHASAASSNVHASSHHHHHRKTDWFVTIIDGTSMKSTSKTQLQTAVKRALNNVLSAANPATTAVCAVDLPLALVRALTSAYYTGAAQVHAVIDESHAKQRALCQQLYAHMVKKGGGLLQHADASAAAHTPSSKGAKDKSTTASASDAKEKVETLYIFSVPDRKADTLFYT
jgi:histidyl-tRNA synthetase